MVVNYLLTILYVLISVIGGGKNSRQENADELFSKDYTTVLKGICCIVVVMVHIPIGYQNPLQDAIGSFAFVAVTLFFMFSGYGMQLSAERKSDYLRHFWRNRLLALLVPCILVNICYFLCNWGIKGDVAYGILAHLNGYVAVLLMYCVWFYIVMKFKDWLHIQKTWIIDSLLIMGVMASSLYDYLSAEKGQVSAQLGWCYERYGLVWGLLMYRFLPTIKQWLTKHQIKKLSIFSVLALMVSVAYLKYKGVYFYGEYLLKIVLGITIIVWMLLLTVKRKYGNRMSLYLGKISYEVYLSHGAVMSVLILLWPQLSSGMFIFLTYTITIMFSMAIHSVGNRLVVRWRAK